MNGPEAPRIPVTRDKTSFPRHPYTCEWCSGEWPSEAAYLDHFESTHKSPSHPYRVPSRERLRPAPALDAERLREAITLHRTFARTGPVAPNPDHECSGRCAQDIAREYEALAALGQEPTDG